MIKTHKMTGINAWPEDDRPREKLLKKGARSLSNSELLAILLRTGSSGVSAIDLARDVMKKFGTFRNMTHTDARDLKTEVFKVVFLGSNNRIIDITDAAIGTVNHAMPIVREIIHSALQKFAVSIICVHNHPSGNIIPSPQDKKFTKDLVGAGKIMNIKIVDHIIIGDGQYFSSEETGLLERSFY